MTKQVAIYAAAVMTTLLALMALWQFRIVILYVVISLALSAALRPLVSRLAGRNLWVRIGLIILCFVVFGVSCVLLFNVLETAINEIQSAAQTAMAQDEWRLPPWLDASMYQRTILAWLPLPGQLFEAITGEQGQLVIPAVLGFTQGLGEILSGVFVILFLSIYWNNHQIHFERLWLSLLPSNHRQQARSIWRTIETDIGAHIRSEFFQSILVGLMFGLGCWLFGSPYPTALALVGALACFIPIAGAIIAVMAVFLVGLLTSVQMSLLTGFYALVILIVLRTWVKPRLFKPEWDNPILSTVLLLAMADAFGLAGFIAAPLLSIIVQILWARLVRRRVVPGDASQVTNIRQRYDVILTAVQEIDSPIPPLVSSSLEKLIKLIEKAEPVLQNNLPADGSEIV